MTITDIHCHANWLGPDIDAQARQVQEVGVSRVCALLCGTKPTHGDR